ncbi:MAG: DUF2062 domain-containing protein [Limnobacter sp.]|nr:DUF2062 domain-containing protein [Limnobacter sp.]
MFRRKIRRFIVAPGFFDRYWFTRKLKPWLGHPALWAINRRSVAGAVAAGLFCGLIPGPFQLFGTLIWVSVVRVNLPLAYAVTLYTNPLTIVPLYLFALAYGHFILGSTGAHSLPPVPHWNWHAWGESLGQFTDWLLNLGPALAVGLPATMLTFSVVGYCLVRLFWNVAVRLAVLRRKKRATPRVQHG